MKFILFFSKCSKFYLDFKNAIKNNLVVRIFPVVVAAVINLCLGENIRPSQSTCQVKFLELHFFQFHVQGFQYFSIKWGKRFIKKANKISATSMTFETPNDRSTFLFLMLKSVRVDNFMNKFWSELLLWCKPVSKATPFKETTWFSLGASLLCSNPCTQNRYPRKDSYITELLKI